MRRLSKALIEQEQNETSVAICRAMALHDQCRVDVLQYHFARLEHILAYLESQPARAVWIEIISSRPHEAVRVRRPSRGGALPASPVSPVPGTACIQTPSPGAGEDCRN